MKVLAQGGDAAGAPRAWSRLRRLSHLLALLVSFVAVPIADDAHAPIAQNWDFTCSGGDGVNQITGNCFQHHSNADARFFVQSSVSLNGYLTGATAGWGAWDQTNGHQFNFIREFTDTSSNASVYVTSGTICGSSTAIGCTTMGVSGGHSVEGSATIVFKTGVASSLRDDVAAHEFGHYVSLGHSDVSSATMWKTVAAGQVSLAAADRLGRCEIYGHSHGYWGGC